MKTNEPSEKYESLEKERFSCSPSAHTRTIIFLKNIAYGSAMGDLLVSTVAGVSPETMQEMAENLAKIPGLGLATQVGAPIVMSVLTTAITQICCKKNLNKEKMLPWILACLAALGPNAVAAIMQFFLPGPAAKMAQILGAGLISPLRPLAGWGIGKLIGKCWEQRSLKADETIVSNQQVVVVATV